MASFSAFMAAEVLGAIDAATHPLPTGTETGLCQPGIGMELTGMPMAQIRSAGDPPPAGVGHDAARIPFYVDDYYNRVHLRPYRIDVGNLTEAMVFEVELFNAWLSEVSLIGVAGVDVEGLPLAGFNPPQEILALTSALGSLEVRLEGPALISGRHVFSFSVGPDLTLWIYGTRIITFPLAPDWTSPVEESLLYWTDVLESRDGTEQRIIMRAWPRWRLGYRAMSGGLDADLLDSMLAGWGGRSFSLALWHKRARLTAPMEAGDTLIPCAPAGLGFKAGDLCVIWRDALHCETLEVSAVTAGGVETARPAGRGYDFGYCAPAKLCHLVGDECEISAIASNLLEADLVFEADEPERVAARAPATMVDGLGLFPYSHDFALARKRRLSRSMSEHDSGLALFSRTDRRGYPIDSLSIEDALLGGHDAIEGLKGFFQWAGGRAKAFWVELREDLLKVSSPIVAGSMLAKVADSAYGLLASSLPNRSRLYFKTRKGWFTAVVTSFDSDGAECVLHLDRAWPVSLEPGEIAQAGFLIKARIDQDELVLSHVADNVARAGVELRGVMD